MDVKYSWNYNTDTIADSWIAQTVQVWPRTNLYLAAPDRAQSENGWALQSSPPELYPGTYETYAAWYHDTHGYSNGLVEGYTRLMMENNLLQKLFMEGTIPWWAESALQHPCRVAPCTPEDPDWLLFPPHYITSGPVGTLKTTSIDNYTPMAVQEYFSSFETRKFHGFDGDSLWYDFSYVTYGVPLSEFIHWDSDIDYIQEGFFALNIPNACNGKVNIESDNESFFRSGTYLLLAKSWVKSSTTVEPATYLGLRDSTVGHLQVVSIGDVEESRVYSTAEEDFTVDAEDLNLYQSTLSGDHVTVTSTSADTEAWYTEVAGAITSVEYRENTAEYLQELIGSCLKCSSNLNIKNLYLDNTTVELTSTTVQDLDVSGSECLIELDNVSLVLVNYRSTELLVTKFGGTGKTELYLGTAYVFDDFDLNISIELKDAGYYKVSMIDSIFYTVPSHLILTGLGLEDYNVKGEDGVYLAEAITYQLKEVIFWDGGGDPRQSWAGTVCTYTVDLGTYPKRGLKEQGIPTGSLLQTQVTQFGLPLVERMDSELDYSILFGPRSGDSTIPNNAKKLRYDQDIATVDDLPLPRCEKEYE